MVASIKMQVLTNLSLVTCTPSLSSVTVLLDAIAHKLQPKLASLVPLEGDEIPESNS